MTEQQLSDDSVCSSSRLHAIRLRLSVHESKRLADVFKALADPTRLQIMDVLSQHQGRISACELAGVVGIPNKDGQRPRQPTISHHLQVLKRAGLICCEKEQQWIYYFVCSDQLAYVRALLEMLR